MYNAGADFVQLTKQLKLKLSHKGAIISKVPQAAKTLKSLLNQIGVDYQVAGDTRDLGTNFTFSKKPSIRKALATKRIKTAKGPLNKIVQLA